jgi:DNA polymerase III subunit epsilon
MIDMFGILNVVKEREEGAPNIFAFVDIETTGTRPLYDRIIDIAVIRVENGRVTETFETLLNPSVPIPSYSSAVSGITNDDVASAQSFDDVALELERILKGAVFVAHNAHFDYGFVKNEFRRIGMHFSSPMLCTVKLSRALYPKERSHDLDALMARHNISCSKRHRAYPDALVMLSWFEDVQKLFSKIVISGEIEKLLFADTLPPLLNRNVLKSLPDTAGIYFFYGPEHELLYVGKSKNIRTRVRSHFSGITSAQEEKLCRQTASVEVTETPGELSALLLESQTIKTHLPLYNRALRRARKLVVATKIDTNGYSALTLQQTETIDPKETIVAVFRSMAQARSTLRGIARTQNLCMKLLDVEHGQGPCFGSQLGTCKGACRSLEDAEIYNERFKKTFNKRAIRSWPYHGTIMIEEKGAHEGTGMAFFVKEWRLLQSIKYDHGDVQEFIPASHFDYDTYKILARYILNPAHRRMIKEVSEQDIQKTLGNEDAEPVVTYA